MAKTAPQSSNDTPESTLFDRFPSITILPDPDDFDAPDNLTVEGLTEAPGALFWAHQHVTQDSSADAAELWLFSKILRVNGKAISPIDLESAPWFSDTGYTACLAHIRFTLNKHLAAGTAATAIKGQPIDGVGESVLSFDDGLTIVAVPQTRESLKAIAEAMAKNSANGMKVAISRVFRFYQNGEVSPWPRATFPRWDGSEATGGDDRFSWNDWALLFTFVSKKYFSRFLT